MAARKGHRTSWACGVHMDMRGTRIENSNDSPKMMGKGMGEKVASELKDQEDGSVVLCRRTSRDIQRMAKIRAA